ncbi:Alkaline phytoceramidase [Prunus dulcis]|uniref:Alkaline phytoceramidase n=1 Tax=Prunus dulcis TaxID=3755 RepID=A0A4Y1QTA0_PRUDU|nr:Alkaline phytoceramidase [Prunus dulcis]
MVLPGEVWGWALFYAGITGLAFGSAYYHLKPDDSRVTWDTLPGCALCFHPNILTQDIGFGPEVPLKNAHEVGKAEMMMTCSVQRLLDARKISVNEESLESHRVKISKLAGVKQPKPTHFYLNQNSKLVAHQNQTYLGTAQTRTERMNMTLTTFHFNHFVA